MPKALSVAELAEARRQKKKNTNAKNLKKPIANG